MTSLIDCGTVWAQTPQFDWPVACEVGRSCFIQQYVDHDPGPGARDYMCGTLVYDAHNGTDIRVLDLTAQRAGVDVLAAAAGVVLRTRDGMPDVSVATAGRVSVKGRDCGNGLVIDHGDGWETQYCHLARDSVLVKSGERVTAGQRLGRVGISGRAEFPHVHFTVRHEKTVVDPFAFKPDPAVCGSGASLWAATLRQTLTYRPRTVLKRGFAPGPVTAEALDEGRVGTTPIGPDSPALVAFVRAIGLKDGDVQRLAVKAPDGQTVADHTTEPLDRNKAQVMLFAGKKRPPTGWPIGDYRATYVVVEDGKVVLEQDFSVTVAAER